MSDFEREDSGEIVWYTMPFEVGLLTSLTAQLVELVAAPAWSDDPLERWANERDAPTLDRDDPALARLFPAASSDADEAAEFRRLMEAEQRTQRATEAQTVRAAVTARTGDMSTDVRIPVADRGAWLRTLNAMRLVLGARLGIADDADAEAIDDLDPDDERAPVADVYHWLGYVQGMLLDAITED